MFVIVTGLPLCEKTQTKVFAHTPFITILLSGRTLKYDWTGVRIKSFLICHFSPIFLRYTRLIRSWALISYRRQKHFNHHSFQTAFMPVRKRRIWSLISFFEFFPIINLLGWPNSNRIAVRSRIRLKTNRYIHIYEFTAVRNSPGGRIGRLAGGLVSVRASIIFSENQSSSES